MHDDDMPTGSEIFEIDTPARVGRLSFLAAASALVLGLFAGTSAHAEPEAPAKGQGGQDARRHKKPAHTKAAHKKAPHQATQTSAKGSGALDLRQRKTK